VVQAVAAGSKLPSAAEGVEEDTGIDDGGAPKVAASADSGSGVSSSRYG
jgi:hypothetical protein